MTADDDFWNAADTGILDPSMTAEEEAAYNKETADSQAEYDFDVDAEEVAKGKHMCVVIPRYNQLQIDIDNEEAFNEHTRRYQEMCGDERSIFSQAHRYDVFPSASRLPHRHIYIDFDIKTLKEKGYPNGFHEIQRIAIQASLNDDPIRVYLNMRRWLNGIPNPTRLFEKPQLVYKTDKGLLYYRKEENQLNYLSACIGDAVARGYGFQYAENLVAFLAEHQNFL